MYQPLEHLTTAQLGILQEPPAPPIDTSFSFDAPPGPQFSDEEMQEQLERGKTFLPTIQDAYKQGADTVQIPPGDYRFAQADTPLIISGITAPPDRPFVIEAAGVTLWFDLKDHQVPAGQKAFRFSRCSNVVFKGATLDRGRGRGNVEGRITAIDRAQNRFEVQPTPGSLPPTARFNASSWDLRIIPFKHDGRLCAPLYALQPGTRKLRYTGVAPSDDTEPGRYWITMRDPDLMDLIHDEAWVLEQGELGVLRVGDGISCIYTGCQAIAIGGSANVTLQGVRCHLTKGGGSEGSGDAGHLWKDCYFGGRPGTCHWQGGDGYMFNASRYGTTLANVTICRTTDDLVNFHGYWGHVDSVDAETNTVTLRMTPDLRYVFANARAGDTWLFFRGVTGVVVGSATVLATKGDRSFVMEPAGGAALSDFVGLMVNLTTHQCSGWAMLGCRLEDCFQRVLIMSGPGLIRDCTFVRTGCGISLNTGMGTVGGFAPGIRIEGCSFHQVAPRPRAAVIDAHGHCLKKDGVPAIEGLVIANNKFVLSSWPAIRLVGVTGARIEGNSFIYEDRDGDGDVDADDARPDGDGAVAYDNNDGACGGEEQEHGHCGGGGGDDAGHAKRGAGLRRGGAKGKGRGGGKGAAAAAAAPEEGECGGSDLELDVKADADADEPEEPEPAPPAASATHPIVLKFADATTLHSNALQGPDHACVAHPLSASALVALRERCKNNVLDENPLPDVK